MLPAPFTSDFLNRLEALRVCARKGFLGSRAGSYSSPRRGQSEQGEKVQLFLLTVYYIYYKLYIYQIKERSLWPKP